MPGDERFVPAAGRASLTRLYDPIMALTMRERAFRPAMVAAVLASNPQVVLDIGCGTGTFAANLAEADPVVAVLGVDGDPEVLAAARARCGSFGERVRFLEGLADHLPVADASVDVVTASLLLHHLAPSGKSKALSEAHRVLRPEGRLVVADWGRPSDPLMRAAFLVLQVVDGVENTRDHAAGRLPELIEHAGFDHPATTGHWRTVWGSLELMTTRRDPATDQEPRNMTRVKRNPVKQIMSEVHKDLRAGKGKADGHESFMAEVKRRLTARGLVEPSDHENPHPINTYEDIARLTGEND